MKEVCHNQSLQQDFSSQTNLTRDQKLLQEKPLNSNANRRTTYRGDGGLVNMSNMQFTPTGLQWIERNYITTRRLVTEKNDIVNDRGKSLTSNGHQ